MTQISCKDYNITFTENVNEEISKYENQYDEIIFITDENVIELYKGVVGKRKFIAIPEGESSKELGTISLIMESLLDMNASRKVLLVAFGGGIVGDITGFIAGIYKRGVDFIQVPTTLLSMVDSSVGGKVGINFNSFKNMIGLFNNPKEVIINTNFIDTLDDLNIRNGIAEMLKIFILLDKTSYEQLCNEDFKDLIINAVKLKLEVVEADFTEQGYRKILNFGHTIAHAIEKHSNNTISHGDAVAIGMYYQLSDKLRKEVDYIYDKYEMPKTYEHINEALKFIGSDKKVEGEYIYEAKVDEIGNSEVYKVKLSKFKDELNV